MIFLTVGTSFPFDRLVRAVDDLVAQGRVAPDLFAQVGRGGYRPRNFASVETLDKKKFDEYFDQAAAVIAHAGMGTITMALERNRPLLVMPRLRRYRELVNDHQLATARRFAQLGHVLAAYEITELPAKIDLLHTFQPAPRASQAGKVAERIGIFLQHCLAEAQ